MAATHQQDRLFGMNVSPLTLRRWRNFCRNRRGYWSLWVFLAIFVFTLFAEFVANDRPFLVYFKGSFYVPIFVNYPETTFGGTFPTEAEYRDPYVHKLIADHGWMIWPLIRYNEKSVAADLPVPPPSPPSLAHLLGTDDQARDVLARVIYGFRISVLFGFVLTVISAVIGVSVGAMQGYFGGLVDLLGQRFIEVWSSMPQLFLLIILTSIVQPSFWWLMALLLLFSWMGFVFGVRAESLRARNLEFVRAAKALGAPTMVVLFRHVLPNAMVVTMTIMPFALAGSVTLLTSLDFLGIGLPPGSASLGEVLAQGKANLQAPWLGFTGFFVIGGTLAMLVFIGEGVRDAFDPRKLFTGPAAAETAASERPARPAAATGQGED